MSTDDRQFVHTSGVEDVVTQLSLSHRVAGSSHGSRERSSACDSSDPGRYACEICICNGFPCGHYLVWWVRVKG